MESKLEYLKKKYESDVMAANLRHSGKNEALLRNRLEYLELVYNVERRKLEDKIEEQPAIKTEPKTKVEKPKKAKKESK